MALKSIKQENQTSPNTKALIVYWSATGNTEQVARTIQKALQLQRVQSTLSKIPGAFEEELCEYDLVFIGSPVHEMLPAEAVQRFVKKKMKLHRERGDIKFCAPKVPGKTAVVFCTYAGPHTGKNEAVPTVKYIGQLLEHIGFNVAEEWYIVGESYSSIAASTKGTFGDTRGRPNEQDLAKVRRKVTRLIKSIGAV